MEKIKILTDTASDLPLVQTDAAGIDMLSFMLTVNGQSYREQRDLSKEEFYELMEHSGDVPATSQITSFAFEEQFRRYLEEGYTDVIYVGINASGSATYQNACAAREALYEDYPEARERLRLHLVDSGNYSLTYGYPVLQAQAMVDAGKPAAEILIWLKDFLSKAGVYFLPMGLKYIHKSGRLTAAAAFAGELLGLRPMIHIAHGSVTVAEKVRGEKNIVPKMCDRISQVMLPNSPYVMISGKDDTYAKKIAETLTARFGRAPAYMGKIGSAVAINAGFDLTAVVVLESEGSHEGAKDSASVH